MGDAPADGSIRGRSRLASAILGVTSVAAAVTAAPSPAGLSFMLYCFPMDNPQCALCE
jgi:hypothetical protein